MDRTTECRNLVFVVVLLFGGLVEQSTDLSQLLEDSRPQIKLYVVFELGLDFDRRALVSIQFLPHLRSPHLCLTSLLQQQHARSEVFKQLRHLQFFVH